MNAKHRRVWVLAIMGIGLVAVAAIVTEDHGRDVVTVDEDMLLAVAGYERDGRWTEPHTTLVIARSTEGSFFLSGTAIRKPITVVSIDELRAHVKASKPSRTGVVSVYYRLPPGASDDEELRPTWLEQETASLERLLTEEGFQPMRVHKPYQRPLARHPHPRRHLPIGGPSEHVEAADAGRSRVSPRT